MFFQVKSGDRSDNPRRDITTRSALEWIRESGAVSPSYSFKCERDLIARTRWRLLIFSSRFRSGVNDSAQS